MSTEQSSKVELKVSDSDHVATLRINDPATRNSVTGEMANALHQGLKKAHASGARALVLCGHEKGFCSGANLGGNMDLNRLSDPNADMGASLDKDFNPLIRALRDAPFPVISAVQGAAAGIGASLALIADLIVAGENAYFLEAFRRIGLVPDGGSSYLLTRAIGRVRAMEMMLLGEKIPAKQALDWGLINRVVPDAKVEETAFALARELAAGPTRALALIRKNAWKATDTDLDTALDAERDGQRIAGKTADFREGVTAFREKRAAKFTGD